MKKQKPQLKWAVVGADDFGVRGVYYTRDEARFHSLKGAHRVVRVEVKVIGRKP